MSAGNVVWVQYVSNIYTYYVAYRLVMDRSLARERARGEVRNNP
jgi:hypothetical protein